MPSMAMAPQRNAAAPPCLPAQLDLDLDHHVLRCLDSCHDLLALHHALSLLLRQGWMDMARARYSMGPSRISHPLFSLKPHSASAQLHLLSRAPPGLFSLSRPFPSSFSLPSCLFVVAKLTSKPKPLLSDSEVTDDYPASSSHMTLLRLDDAGNTNSQSANSDSHTSKPRRQGSPQDLPPRSGAASRDWSHDEDVAYRRLMAGEGDSVSDAEAAVDTQTNGETRPLRWFGALVSPHLQSAQTSFESALEILVKIANAQREALHAHNQVMQHPGGKILDEPSSLEAVALQNLSTS